MAPVQKANCQNSHTIFIQLHIFLLLFCTTTNSICQKNNYEIFASNGLNESKRIKVLYDFGNQPFERTPKIRLAIIIIPTTIKT